MVPKATSRANQLLGGLFEMIAVRPQRLIGAVALAVLLAAACGQSSASQPSNLKLVAEMAFTYDSLDPDRGVFGTCVTVDKSVYDTLLALNPKDTSKPYPSLATSYTASSDAKTFTFKLRQGVKFASGNPFTSADVVFSINRNAGIANPNASVVTTGLSVTAPDSFTVVITSSSANPALPVLTTQSNFVILDSKLVQENGGTTTPQDKAEDYLNGPSKAGTGPYYIDSVDRTSQIVLKANPNYWGPKPTYTTVILRNVPAATQRLDVQDGQAQLAMDISTQDAASLGSSLNLVSAPTAGHFFLIMNLDPSVSKLTSNQSFREAVKYGIDYQGLLAIGGKGSVEMSGFVPKGILGALPASDDTQRDLTRAKAALAQVSIANPTVDLIYPTDYGKNGVTSTIVATKIQSDLKDVGITVNLKGMPSSEAYGQAKTNKEVMLLSPAQADFPDPSNLSYYEPGGFFAGWFNWNRGSDASVDSLVDQAGAAVDPATRGQAYQQLQLAMNAKIVEVFLFQTSLTLVAAKSVHPIVNSFYVVDFGLIT
jgi:peptide/nickel transport system substrate-binding protein